MHIRMLSGPNDDVTYLALEGRLDLDGARQIDTDFTAKTATRRRPAIIDLAAVDFLASIGMRLLLSTARALGKTGNKLVLLKPQNNVAQALEMAGLSNLLPIAASEGEAFQIARAE